MAERRKTGGRSKSTSSSSSGSKSTGSRSSGSKRSGKRESAEDRSRIRGTAPSAADISKLELMEPSEEAKEHEPSTVDAMGQDKRREVVGHSYGPSRRSQVMFFVIVGVIVVAIVGGSMAAVAAFDTIPDELPDEAPWSKNAARPEAQEQQQA